MKVKITASAKETIHVTTTVSEANEQTTTRNEISFSKGKVKLTFQTDTPDENNIGTNDTDKEYDTRDTEDIDDEDDNNDNTNDTDDEDNDDDDDDEDNDDDDSDYYESEPVDEEDDDDNDKEEYNDDFVSSELIKYLLIMFSKYHHNISVEDLSELIDLIYVDDLSKEYNSTAEYVAEIRDFFCTYIAIPNAFTSNEIAEFWSITESFI